MLLYRWCQAEPIFISSDGKAARAAGLFPGIWQIGGVWCYVHHTSIGTIPTQPTPKNTESFSIHCSIPQRRTATCPERGSARGKSGLRNSERLPPSQTCPLLKCPPERETPTAQVSPLKGKRPLPKCPPERETPTAQVSPKKENALCAGAYVRRPTVYNIWYNFLINFVNSTFPCIL